MYIIYVHVCVYAFVTCIHFPKPMGNCSMWPILKERLCQQNFTIFQFTHSILVIVQVVALHPSLQTDIQDNTYVFHRISVTHSEVMKQHWAYKAVFIWTKVFFDVMEKWLAKTNLGKGLGTKTSFFNVLSPPLLDFSHGIQVCAVCITGSQSLPKLPRRAKAPADLYQVGTPDDSMEFMEEILLSSWGW